MRIREAPFALRVVERQAGRCGIVYRRRPDEKGRDRLQKVATFSPLAFSAAAPLLREAAKACGVENSKGVLTPGRFLPLDADWGARAACLALISTGLRDAGRLLEAASQLRHSDGNEAAWWLGMLHNGHSIRALRALRILTGAVE